MAYTVEEVLAYLESPNVSAADKAAAFQAAATAGDLPPAQAFADYAGIPVSEVETAGATLGIQPARGASPDGKSTTDGWQVAPKGDATTPPAASSTVQGGTPPPGGAANSSAIFKHDFQVDQGGTLTIDGKPLTDEQNSESTTPGTVGWAASFMTNPKYAPLIPMVKDQLAKTDTISPALAEQISQSGYTGPGEGGFWKDFASKAGTVAGVVTGGGALLNGTGILQAGIDAGVQAGMSIADATGLAQMAVDAGATTAGQVSSFVSSGGTLGSSAAATAMAGVDAAGTGFGTGYDATQAAVNSSLGAGANSVTGGAMTSVGDVGSILEAGGAPMTAAETAAANANPSLMQSLQNGVSSVRSALNFNIVTDPGMNTAINRMLQNATVSAVKAAVFGQDIGKAVGNSLLFSGAAYGAQGAVADFISSPGLRSAVGALAGTVAVGAVNGQNVQQMMVSGATNVAINEIARQIFTTPAVAAQAGSPGSSVTSGPPTDRNADGTRASDDSQLGGTPPPPVITASNNVTGTATDAPPPDAGTVGVTPAPGGQYNINPATGQPYPMPAPSSATSVTGGTYNIDPATGLPLPMPVTGATGSTPTATTGTTPPATGHISPEIARTMTAEQLTTAYQNGQLTLAEVQAAGAGRDMTTTGNGQSVTVTGGTPDPTAVNIDPSQSGYVPPTGGQTPGTTPAPLPVTTPPSSIDVVGGTPGTTPPPTTTTPPTTTPPAVTPPSTTPPGTTSTPGTTTPPINLNNMLGAGFTLSQILDYMKLLDTTSFAQSIMDKSKENLNKPYTPFDPAKFMDPSGPYSSYINALAAPALRANDLAAKAMQDQNKARAAMSGQDITSYGPLAGQPDIQNKLLEESWMNSRAKTVADATKPAFDTATQEYRNTFQYPLAAVNSSDTTLKALEPYSRPSITKLLSGLASGANTSVPGGGPTLLQSLGGLPAPTPAATTSGVDPVTGLTPVPDSQTGTMPAAPPGGIVGSGFNPDDYAPATDPGYSTGV